MSASNWFYYKNSSTKFTCALVSIIRIISRSYSKWHCHLMAHV